MSTTLNDLERFTEFVHQYQASGRSLPELFDLWILEDLAEDEHVENVAAVNASIRDFLNGKRGTPAGEHSKQLREEFGVGDE